MTACCRLRLTRLTTFCLSAVFAVAMVASAHAAGYKQTNLVSDIAGAQQTDPNLVNPWGMSSSATGPLWISDNGTGLSSVYVIGTTVVNPLVVTVPPPLGSPAGTTSAPTGNVFNIAGSGFSVTNGTVSGSSVFMFATEDGTISGWSPTVDPTHAQIAVDNSVEDKADQQRRSAVYKGLAIATTTTGTFIYASNFRGGFVEQYDSNFNLVRTFTDHTLPNSFAPFGIQAIGNRLYVTYAKTDPKKHDDRAGAGRGFVDVFDFDGNLVTRLITRGALNSPWGVAVAPANFGQFSNALLIGNFGDGHINAFNATTGAFLGTLSDTGGTPLEIDGLWGIRFGNGGQAGPQTTLFFTAGIDDEAHGLFGSITTQ